MKKKPFIPVLACAVIFLGICGVLGFQYWNLDNRYQSLTAEAAQLKERNSGLNEQLEDSSAELEEKEDYIEGQKDYITELAGQIQELGKEETEEEQTEDWYSSHKYKDDPYPSLYADKDTAPVQTGQKYVYLTFDDGPSALTPKVLDLLDEYEAHATFFVVGKDKEEYAEYLPEIVTRGHTLALHSYSHDYNQIYRSVDAFLEDYEKIYDWNVSSGDGSDLTTSENIIDNICSNVKYIENPVVLMHDGPGKYATLNALPTVLQKLSDAGYEFRSLDQYSEPVQYRQAE